MSVPCSNRLKLLAVALSLTLAVLSAACTRPNGETTGRATSAPNSAPTWAGAPTPRHLVLISLDTFRADHLRRELTPNLAALADESVRFDDFATVAPSTLASHTSLFTGLYPHQHGVASNGWIVPQELETLAERLRRDGFHNAGVVGSFALLDRFGIDQGFDHWSQDFDQTVGVDEVDQSQRRADRVVDAAVAYLEGHFGDDASESASRLFLFVHFFDTHYPYEPPDALAASLVATPTLEWTEPERKKSESIDGEAPEELARRYAGEAAFVDEQVGRLLDELDRRGLLDEALVAVTSDHGEALWQHGERWHATEVYDSTIHGIFFARLPSHGSGSAGVPADVDGAVGTVDVMPTLLQALGLPVPEGLDGEAFDLRALPENGVDRRRFSQATGSHVDVPEIDPDTVAGEPWVRWPNDPLPRSVRQGRWKLIQWPLEGREALFDLAADPGERTNLIDEPPEGVDIESLRRALGDWARSADPLPSHFDRDFELDTRRQLCALGYVECPDDE